MAILQIPINQILQGDVLERLKGLPDGCIYLVVFSPPYFAVRDYQVDGQLGLERIFDCTPFLLRQEQDGFCGECYLCKMVAVMKEVYRVLHKNGNVLVNLGDTFFTNAGFGKDTTKFVAEKEHGGILKGRAKLHQLRKSMKGYYKPKCLCLIPERFVTAMVDRVGFISRGKPIWEKTNGFPQSAPDRWTLDYENWYHLTKTGKYYFNKEVIREALKTNTLKRMEYAERPFNQMTKGVNSRHSSGSFHFNMPRFGGNKHAGKNGNATYSGKEYKPRKDGKKSPGSVWPHSTAPFLKEFCLTCDKFVKNKDLMSKCQDCGEIYRLNPADIARMNGLDPEQKCLDCGRSFKRHFSPNSADRVAKVRGEMVKCPSIKIEGTYKPGACPKCGSIDKDLLCPDCKNVIHAHYAMYPASLIDPIIKACCPEQVCIKCGTPRFPIRKPSKKYAKHLGKGWNNHKADKTQGQMQSHYLPSVSAEYEIAAWTVCKCKEPEYRPGNVLDPFAGWCTTAEVALKNGREFLMIELDPRNVQAGRKRIDPLLHEKFQK